MDNLKVVAHLHNGLAVLDNWSPDLPSLLEWLLLDEMGMVSANPTASDIAATRSIVEESLPLARGSIKGEWYWQSSSPCYVYKRETIDRFRKRWSPGIDTPPPRWGKRKPTWDNGAGGEKAYDLPLYLRSTPEITWYCRGDRDEVARLLAGCRGLGKKRGHGHGQVRSWRVENHGPDWHLWGPSGELMRPMPSDLIGEHSSPLRSWGWRPPGWHHGNKATCAMPVHTARRVD